MAVLLTISETISGAAVADSLASPGPTNLGADIGNVINGSYGPVTTKADNTGRLDLFIRHNGVNPITDVKTFIQVYGTGTGYGYGGADTAANDYAAIKAQGNSSGSSKNNADGLSGGLWVDMNAILTDTAGSSQFDFNTNGYDSVGGTKGGDDTVRIYGDNNLDGLDLATAFTVNVKAMVTTVNQALGGDATNGYKPTAPVQGSIGPAGDNALGTRAHLKLRLYALQATVNGSVVQWEYVVAYSYTA